MTITLLKRPSPLISLLPFLFFLFVFKESLSQAPIARLNRESFITSKNDLFGKKYSFIENIGQYGGMVPKCEEFGRIKYAYEGSNVQVLFTPKGLIFFHRIREKVRLQKNKEKDEEMERQHVCIDRVITMKWIGANPKVAIIAEEENPWYQIYGMIERRARGFRKITYHNLFPGIDVIYTFKDLEPGFEYTIVAKPGSDLSQVKMSYGGDLRSVRTDREKNLLISSDIDTIIESSPLCYYSGQKRSDSTVVKNVSRVLEDRLVKFELPKGYDKSKTLIIDPFISNTNNLTETNAKIAKDIDFDYDGNVFVSGGGFTTLQQLAKYDSNGVLQWTYSGSTFISPTDEWVFGVNYGGWVVDKQSGKIYLGQGWGVFSGDGVRVIRLTAAGTYDGFITQQNPSFEEGWKLLWVCNNGNPKIFVAGGGPTSNINFGIFSPPSAVITTQNITGINGTAQQDVADAIFDPITEEIYSVFGSPLTVPKNLYKLSPPYLPANILWNTDAGFNVFKERNNRPYLFTDDVGNDNSVNTLAVNSQFLFYWDGKNLAAFNKLNGGLVGNPITISSNNPLYQGGIAADECGNVFVGSTQGIIKVYKFDGLNFNDVVSPDITVTGFSNNAIYDLAYDPSKKLLYACGNGFVGSFDVSFYCNLNTYSLQLNTNCTNSSVTTSISPAPPAGSLINYNLYDGQTFIANNSTGLFTGLDLNKTYSLKILINQDCSGIELESDVLITGVSETITTFNACESMPGKIIVSGNGGMTPYMYSLDETNFQTSNTFSQLAPGNYVVTIKDANGCTETKNTIVSQTINCLSATAISTAAICASNTGSITVNVTNGSSPYTYSLDGMNFQSSNVFDNLAAGSYKIIIKDAIGSTNDLDVIVSSNNGLKATGFSSTETCVGKNGSINVSTIGAIGNISYSLNGVDFQTSNSFSGLSAGPYDVIIKDSVNCSDTLDVVVPFTNSLSVNAGGNKTICEGNNVIITASSNGNEFSWTPTNDLSNSSVLNPIASPAITTSYKIKASLGVCTMYDSVIVFVDPAPIPDAGSDTTICLGQSIQLKGSGGSSYNWSPNVYLNDAGIPNPIATKPLESIVYSLNVTDNNGCQSIHSSQVKINVTSNLNIFAGNDTAVLVNSRIQLNAIELNGSLISSFLWSPSIGLNNPTISNPMATLNSNMTYTVTGYTSDGCEDSDTINIKVFSKAEIYVPTAFTPNGDGKNDQLKAFPFGIKEFKYFTIYNRWGEVVFNTNDYSKGWDGLLNGIPQSSSIFIWMVKGIDFIGNIIERKGTSALIR